jgi:hypothetical protein
MHQPVGVILTAGVLTLRVWPQVVLAPVRTTLLPASRENRLRQSRRGHVAVGAPVRVAVDTLAVAMLPWLAAGGLDGPA